MTVQRGFLDFMNAAAVVAHAFWPDGSTEARFRFSFKPQLTSDIPTVRFALDTQSRSYSQMATGYWRFNWIGASANRVRVEGEIDGRDVTLAEYPGTWALFKLFRDANWQSTSSSSYRVRWDFPVQDQTVRLEGELQLETPPILMHGYFNDVRRCVETIVR
jgi:type VI protein secretion system component VasK